MKRHPKPASGKTALFVKIPVDMKARIERLSIASKHFSQQDVIRISLEKGLPLFETFCEKIAAA